MKKAFTLLELVFVVVVIGILAAVVIPSTKTNPLQEAAIQVASHIKYTQHLAMIDDKFDTNTAFWYKQRWQLVFGNAVPPNNDTSYTIFSDSDGLGGDADIGEIAVNPQDPSLLLSGGYGHTITTEHSKMTGKMNLESSYGVSKVSFNGGCSGLRISFDHLGRPMKGDQSSMNGPYRAPTKRLITAVCNIVLTDGSDSITIKVEPETGYTCVWNSDLNRCI